MSEEEKLKGLLKEKEKQVYEDVKCCINWLIELGNKVMSGTESERQQAISEFLKRTFMISREQCYALRIQKEATLYTFYLDPLPVKKITPSSIRCSICRLKDDGAVEEAELVVCEWEWELSAKARAFIKAVTEYISKSEELPIP